VTDGQIAFAIIAAVGTTLGLFVALGTIVWRLASKLQELESELKTLKHQVDRIDVEIKRLDREQVLIARDGANQWHEVQRTLGQIEGVIQGSSPHRRSRP
jgi:hypothetical protein